MRIVVCGGRNYGSPPWPVATQEQLALADRQREHVYRVLDSMDVDEVCHGRARGADLAASDWASSRRIPCQEFPAHWRPGGVYDPRAGLRRNWQMLDEFKPDLIVAFPGGKGTAHMMTIAKRSGVEVLPVKGCE